MLWFDRHDLATILWVVLALLALAGIVRGETDDILPSGIVASGTEEGAPAYAQTAYSDTVTSAVAGAQAKAILDSGITNSHVASGAGIDWLKLGFANSLVFDLPDWYGFMKTVGWTRDDVYSAPIFMEETEDGFPVLVWIPLWHPYGGGWNPIRIRDLLRMSLSASDITTGTLSDDLLTTNVALLDRANEFSEAQHAPGFYVPDGSGEVGVDGGVRIQFDDGKALLFGDLQVSENIDTVTGEYQIDGVTVIDTVRQGFFASLTLETQGEGSGLDADLLDGQHGSYYTNASNLTTGTLAVERMEQGPGSGLDADTLDGEDSSDFHDAAQLTGTLADERLSANVPLLDAVNQFIETLGCDKTITAANFALSDIGDIGILTGGAPPYLHFDAIGVGSGVTLYNAAFVVDSGGMEAATDINSTFGALQTNSTTRIDNSGAGTLASVTVPDDGWIGLGSGKALLTFNDATVDEFLFTNGNLKLSYDSGSAPPTILVKNTNANYHALMGAYNSGDDKAILVAWGSGASGTSFGLSRGRAVGLYLYPGAVGGVVGTQTNFPLYFGTNATWRWQITTGGALAPNGAGYDIGDATNQVDEIFVGTGYAYDLQWVDVAAAALPAGEWGFSASGYLATSSDGKIMFAPVRITPGSVMTQLRVKYGCVGDGDGVKYRFLKRDETSDTAAWTVIGAQQTATGSFGDVAVSTYNFADETAASGYSYVIEVESEVVDLGSKLYAVGIETSKRAW